MDSTEIEYLKKRIKKHEGYRKLPYNLEYKTTDGKVVKEKFSTAGFGHVIQKGEVEPEGGYTKKYWEGIFEKDFNNAYNGALKLLGDSNVHPTAVGIVTEMVYQMGYTGVSKFEDTLKLIKGGRYQDASIEMLDSRWAKKQTNERAINLSKIMKSLEANIHQEIHLPEFTNPLERANTAFSQPSISSHSGEVPGIFGRQPDGTLFDAKGMAALRKGFGDQSVYVQGLNYIRGETQDQTIDHFLQIFRETSERPTEPYVPTEDEFVLVQPEQDQFIYAQSQSPQETAIIAQTLKGIRAVRQEAFAERPASMMLGMLVADVFNPGTLASFGVRSVLQLPKVAAKTALDETILQNLDPDRPEEFIGISIAGNTLLPASTVMLSKTISHLTGKVRKKAIMNYIDHTEDLKAKVQADETGPWGARSPDDELPFTEGPLGDVERRAQSVKMTPEDELDEFDVTKHLDPAQTETSTGGKFMPENGIPRSDGEKLTPAMGLEKLKDNPVKRNLMGNSNLARLLTVHLVEHPFFQMKNLGGDKSFIGVSRIIASEWIGQRMVPAIKETEKFYIAYRKGFGGDQKTLLRQRIADKFQGTGNALGVDDFLEEVAKAKRRLNDPNIKSMYPKEVIEAAQMWDDVIYRPLSEAARKNRMFSIKERRELVILKRKHERIDTSGDPAKAAETVQKSEKAIAELQAKIKALDNLDINRQFLNRLYNTHYLGSEAGRKHWYEVLARNGYTFKEAEAARQSILGKAPYADIKADPVGMARSLKERTLADIPDTALEPFLENNMMALGRYYAVRMGSDVEMFKKFGSIDLQPQIRAMMKEYDDLINATKGAKAKKDLLKEKKQAVEDIEVLRDRVRGTYGYTDNPDSWSNKSIRMAKMWNATSMLTGALAAVPDIGMLVLEAGINSGFKSSFEALFKNTDLIKLAYQEANLAGEALDMTLSMRAALFADLGESISMRTPIERAMSHGTQAFFNINLMNPWTTGMKSVASLMIGTRMIDDAIKSSRHLRNSGSAKVVFKDDLRGRKGQPIAASYNRKTNTVSMNKEELEASYKSRAWETPSTEGIRPLPKGTINSMEDWKRFVTEHELSHADHAIKIDQGETLVAYENRINSLVLRRMKIKGKIEDYNRLRLLNVGIKDEMAARIAGESENFGYFGEHVRIARTHLWEDQEAANVYRAALGKDIARTIVTPGPGDLPNTIGGGIQHLFPASFRESVGASVDNIADPKVRKAVEAAGSVFLSPEMSRLIFQFKSFAIAAQHRVLTPGLQQMNKNTLQGVLALIGMGALVDSIRRQQRGGGGPDGFGSRLTTAIERSGALGYFPDVFRLMETGTRAWSNPGNFASSVGGPIVPQISNVADVLFDYSGFGTVDKATNKHLIDALPLSNVAHMKFLFDYSKGAVNAATGVE